MCKKNELSLILLCLKGIICCLVKHNSFATQSTSEGTRGDALNCINNVLSLVFMISFCFLFSVYDFML